jgi:N-hydroxyarylamine O-acetyltransferase
MDIERYLEKINVHSGIRPDPKTLFLLHRKHLYNIPFENLDIHSGRKIILEEDRLLSKIIDERRGGFCYELNGSFYVLLNAIGFDVKRISAGVYEREGKFSPDFDHMALIVSLNETEYLSDVGFGDSFLEPLKLKTDEIQEDRAGFFRITKSGDGDHFILHRALDGEDFIPQYKFGLAPRKLNEFNHMCEYHETSPESHFMQKIICSKATEKGRITLSDRKLIVTENGKKEQKDITESDFHLFLKQHFNITLRNKLIFPG